jgi:hypothetical protein
MWSTGQWGADAWKEVAEVADDQLIDHVRLA